MSLTLCSQSVVQDSTLATSAARSNFTRNLAWLGASSVAFPIELQETLFDVQWTFGRDGSLTGKTHSGQWRAGTGLPRRLSQAMLKQLTLHGSTGCFLAPFHAAAVETALGRLTPQQALVCVVPDVKDFRFMLHCADFTRHVDAGRLYFAAGDDWRNALARLLDDHPGLATPSQFIKLPTLSRDIADGIIPAAQGVFAEVNGRRAVEIERLRKQVFIEREEPCVCVIAPSRFRLWNDVGAVLMGLFDGSDVRPTVRRFDPDEPGENSPLALARVLTNCTAMLTANTSRGDLPGVLPDSAPWVTWLTAGRIPPPPLTAAHDRLIVADATLKSAAIAAGWAAAHVHVGTWPLRLPEDPPADKCLAVLADTASLDTPDDLDDFSSHRLLWETIRAELLADPFRLPDDLHGFLRDRMTRAAIAVDGFDRQRFIDKLIVPAYQHGLVRTLTAAGFPVRIYGKGWDGDPTLAPIAAGEIETRDAFTAAVGSSSALVHVWPRRGTHAVEFTGRPVVRRTTNKRQTFIRDARLALAGHATPPRDHEPALPISAEMILNLLPA